MTNVINDDMDWTFISVRATHYICISLMSELLDIYQQIIIMRSIAYHAYWSISLVNKINEFAQANVREESWRHGVGFTRQYKSYPTRRKQKNIVVCNTLLLARYLLDTTFNHVPHKGNAPLTFVYFTQYKQIGHRNGILKHSG